jgi:hypothetical protein
VSAWAGSGPAASVDPRAVIPFERITGPVLLTCGGLDLEWPSCSFVDDVTQRLSAHHFRHPVTVLRYPDGGHPLRRSPTGRDLHQPDGGRARRHRRRAQRSSAEAEAEAEAKILALLGAR